MIRNEFTSFVLFRQKYSLFLYKLHPFRSQFLSIKNKIKLYKTLIRPVPAYGSETWVLSKSDEAILGVFERKILRAIFGPTNDNGEWRIKYMSYIYCTRKVI